MGTGQAVFNGFLYQFTTQKIVFPFNMYVNTCLFLYMWGWDIHSLRITLAFYKADCVTFLWRRACLSLSALLTQTGFISHGYTCLLIVIHVSSSHAQHMFSVHEDAMRNRTRFLYGMPCSAYYKATRIFSEVWLQGSWKHAHYYMNTFWSVFRHEQMLSLFSQFLHPFQKCITAMWFQNFGKHWCIAITLGYFRDAFRFSPDRRASGSCWE
jgi:hypothetical protein